jgi:hypothetical protein
MLTEAEKAELREMAGSLTIREEFQTLRRNSRTREFNISVDDLIRWLTAMAQICPESVRSRPFVHYTHVKI